MALEDVIAREYLSPPKDSFWEWHEDGEVLAWRGGKTIAFREEVRTVLEWLAPTGLPRLGGLALLLAATRQNWSARGSEAEMLASMVRETEQWSRQSAVLREVLSGLDKVHALDEDLRVPVRSKAVLADVVFGRAERQVPADQAAVIVEAMHRGLGELLTGSEQNLISRGFGPILLILDLASIAPGLRRVNAEALRLRMETGLDGLPGPAELELTPSQAARALLDALEDDAELSGLARVARHLLALASLPRSLSAAEEQDTGGVSDIANRGPLERLLVSELANDDLTLAVRVAMNEALYVRREAPPRRPPRHRALLLDAGIRSWGIPRVFATAVALAFTATSAECGSIACYRARGSFVDEVDLTSRQGVVQHLESLEPDLNYADAIPSFFQALGDNAERAEPVLVMPEDAINDPAIQEALRRVDLPQVFIATVTREGVFRLFERHPRGMKRLREATVAIDDLFDQPPDLVEDGHATCLPAILSVDPFPLLLSHEVECDRSWYVAGWGALALTRDGRLMHWSQAGQGARQLGDALPAKVLHWAAPSAVEGETFAVVGDSEGNLELLRIQQRGIAERIALPSGGRRVASHNGVLFAEYSDGVRVLSMSTGEVLQTLQLPDGVTRSGRFCYGRDARWYALSYDGVAAHLQPIAPESRARRWRNFLAMFDQFGKDGPVTVTDTGDLFSTATQALQRVPHGLERVLYVPWISVDGRRLCLTGLPQASDAPSRVLVDTCQFSATPVRGKLLDDRVRQLVRPTNLHKRFSAIGVTGHGELVLKRLKGHVLRITVRNRLPLFEGSDVGGGLRHLRGFGQTAVDDRGYKLCTAEWPDGSRAVLDSRGLLHLRSADRSIPEVTLVLAEGELTGWCSDGRRWGKAYFVGEDGFAVHSAAEQRSIYESTIRRFVACIDA